ncbi:MAG: hypothetical protein KatS3mg103_0776 [Phycisphaerales bacterium]|nr:MAG: hypothetical protein KatS3mg103_0776 [Phycisphaerales bacterium]
MASTSSLSVGSPWPKSQASGLGASAGVPVISSIPMRGVACASACPQARASIARATIGQHARASVPRCGRVGRCIASLLWTGPAGAGTHGAHPRAERPGLGAGLGAGGKRLARAHYTGSTPQALGVSDPAG